MTYPASAASRRESSILKERCHSVFARLPRSKLRGMRSLPNSISTTGAASVALRCACPLLLFPKPRKAAVHLFFRPTDAGLLHSPFVLSLNTSVYSYLKKLYNNDKRAGILQEKTDVQEPDARMLAVRSRG